MSFIDRMIKWLDRWRNGRFATNCGRPLSSCFRIPPVSALGTTCEVAPSAEHAQSDPHAPGNKTGTQGANRAPEPVTNN